ncbi:hypothetical protein [Hypericibacter sp.]|uniref:hypothetical protein n=1 Tax=Hypericibacter sp. TaxID=2705401 RepID=UPI003D6D6D90
MATVQAARNNADWCDAVARSHGAGGKFLPELWFSAGKLPLFYPNLITLTADGQATQRDRVTALLENGPPLPWAVKDSFAALDLTAQGFDCLFEASWIQLSPDEVSPPAEDLSIRWHRIERPEDLVAWETAWRRDLSAGSAAIFQPALLQDPSIAILAGRLGDEIVAGCVLCLSAEAIGLSNLFGPEAARASVWNTCRREAQARAPGLPIVGYERDEDLALAREAGFRAVGPLRVWLWTGSDG